jgi:hypothetical protein
MAHMLETPSRVWRRIEAQVASGREMPSLPSMPGFDDSALSGSSGSDSSRAPKDLSLDLDLDSDGSRDLPQGHHSIHPIQSTPSQAGSFATARPGMFGGSRQGSGKGPDSASSTARFAQSIASRSTRSSRSGNNTNTNMFSRNGSGGLKSVSHRSFDDVSIIQPASHAPDGYEISLDLPSMEMSLDQSKHRTEKKNKSAHGSFNYSFNQPSLPAPTEELEMDEASDAGSLADALESTSRTGSPDLDLDDDLEADLPDFSRAPDVDPTPRKKHYDYSLRSTPRVSLYLFSLFNQICMLMSDFRHPHSTKTNSNTSPSTNPSLLLGVSSQGAPELPPSPEQLPRPSHPLATSLPEATPVSLSLPPSPGCMPPTLRMWRRLVLCPCQDRRQRRLRCVVAVLHQQRRLRLQQLPIRPRCNLSLRSLRLVTHLMSTTLAHSISCDPRI